VLEYVNVVNPVTVTVVATALNEVSPVHTTVTTSPVVRPWLAAVVKVLVFVSLVTVLIVAVKPMLAVTVTLEEPAVV